MESIEVKIPPLDRRTEEAFKTLRTNLQFCGKDVKSIALTSCTPNEGKSSVSLQLARSLSENGKRVLFIDADLRKSVILSRCQVSQTVKGLSHYLSGQCAFTDAVYMTNVKNLHMIFAGPVPPNPAELLGSNAFKIVIEKMKTVYDYIIIDTPPLGSVIDAAVIANECDGSILVVKSGEISRRFARKIVDQLRMADCPILGAILNSVDMKKNSYGNYYGKYYGKYYGQEVDKYLEG
ncbi:MAG: CpsD/CapB family tyrosine-protein kinase [Frisingicoccus sp.]|uniref:CpsD/CapB family tyrosine-protein kinase n=1 Tax=Frisingicoccus sp. TaxID=1918627 RepID=UPI002A806B1E|nr:CpsD/CapB family tyrosine-protein kinase [Frisingicoccus sp.]MDY4833862.1 CpsD/CapB family tyrosine-protein kinase [Frisingicoccus sp.]